MMAVDSKPDSTSPAPNGAAAPTRRKRSSSLLAVRSSLPSVESSLDEFIAKANQTLVDAASWQAAGQQAKAEDERRREADALRWKAAEQQLREGEAREHSLRRQLDGLQGKLAEAEARAAVASNGNNEGIVAELRLRLNRTEERITAAEDRARSAEERAGQLAEQLEAARAAAATAVAAPPPVTTRAPSYSDADVEQRLRLAE